MSPSTSNNEDDKGAVNPDPTITKKTTVLDQFEDHEWTGLPQWVREAATVLGHTPEVWEDDAEPASEEKTWVGLTDAEREAAKSLGYTSELWDDDDGSSSSSSSSSDEEGEPDEAKPRPNLLCVQLYTETSDYRLRMKKNMGVSMYVNRDTAADEKLFRFPVGPDLTISRSLLKASDDGAAPALTPERKAFADRFLEWQSVYGDGAIAQENRDEVEFVGASECGRPLFTLADFYNTSADGARGNQNDGEEDDRYHLPTKDNNSYMIEMVDTDYVLVEFIPHPTVVDDCDDDTAPLPPSRRFEILPYDESICWDGEEGYNPAELLRPPTFCAHEYRSVELPGHFSNHACGSTATAYDTIRLATPADGDTGGCPIVAPALSESVRLGLRDMVKNRKMEELPENVMTTSRRLKRGEEVLTDYALWHWSNEDYMHGGESQRVPDCEYWEDYDWFELPLRVRNAIVPLGITRKIWDDDDAPDPPAYKKDWKDLTSAQQKGAVALGYTKRSWKCESDCDSDDEGSKWSLLSPPSREAAEVLGYDESLWNSSVKTPCFRIGWQDLPPAQRKAATVLGYNSKRWKDPMEPWFDCLCGDKKCHSVDGFQGVKSFSIEEQERIYWVCSGWIQNQIDWKLYQIETTSLLM